MMKFHRSLPDTNILEENSLVIHDDSKRAIRFAYTLIILIFVLLILWRWIIFNESQFGELLFGIGIAFFALPFVGQSSLRVNLDKERWKVSFYKKFFFVYVMYKSISCTNYQMEVRTWKFKRVRFIKLIFKIVDSNSKFHFKLRSNQVMDVKEFAEINNIELKILRRN